MKSTATELQAVSARRVGNEQDKSTLRITEAAWP